ncbi:asparagine synthase-related protein [Halobellus sp. GM3]|uniref:asparagine synthase-related protein n=1 Tax=Halobellus sp. GM3 TaxID=3458410 RepID=UPI00403DF841
MGHSDDRPSGDGSTDVPTLLDGASPELVSVAVERRDPLPGTAGFAGALDGRLVRDVLGRRPLFVDADDPSSWAFDPRALSAPVSVPAGTVREIGAADVSGDRHWRLPDPRPTGDDDRALDAVREAVLARTRAVSTLSTADDELTAGDNGMTADDDGSISDDDGTTAGTVAVAFSGGIDSAVVAAGVPDAPCYVAGFEGCHDVAAAREAAAAMDRDLRVVELTHDALRAAVPTLVAATGRTNPMDLSIALPLFLVAERVAADGFDRLALGQGADELFGGYAKVAKAPGDPRVDADTVRGARREVVETLPDQAERDVLAVRAGGAEPIAPLLHDDVVAAALRLPGHLLVDGERRKVALREAARGVVPDSVRTADKKAVQYGTYVARELDRLARQAGYKRRMDDHVERYVRSIVGDDTDEQR